MSVYTVFSENPQPELRSAIEREFPGAFHHWSPTVSFIQGAGPVRSIAEQLGIKSRDPNGIVSGTIDSAFVMEASPSYFGWSKATLWEWLKGSFEADR